MFGLKKFSLSLGILLCLSLISFNHILANGKQTSDHDTDSFYLPADPDEPFDSLNALKTRYFLSYVHSNRK